MKIAILTQPLGFNYGGIMQAWALQQVLKRMGHNPVTIDRQPDRKSLPYRSARTIYRVLSRTVGKGKSPIFRERALTTVGTHTQSFIRSNIVMSPKIDSTKELRAHFLSASYQAVIVGSDQTWRPAYSPNIYNFFLDFLPEMDIKKVAYASSFGVDQWEYNPKQEQLCTELARKFDFIGVRETSAVTLCAEHLGVTAHPVLDPTLLLTADDYRELIDRHQTGSKASGGLYTYFLDKSPSKQTFTNKLSKKLHLSPFNTQATESITDWRGGNIDSYIMPSPIEWLKGFRDGDFILTDSFHGVVFSIIFGKPFIAINNKSRGSARFKSLLSSAGLQNNIVEESTNEDGILDALNTIHQKSATNRLSNKIEQSLKFLHRSLSHED